MFRFSCLQLPLTIYIIQSSRHTSHSRTLIDNSFSNLISKDITSDNVTARISDNLPQFLISSNTFADPAPSKSNVLKRTAQVLTRTIFC